jgi:hypothetical protein
LCSPKKTGDALLKHISLTSFKSFKNKADVPLAAITLIYGANSSGKSSIVQALMLLKQTIEAAQFTAAPLVFRSKRYLDLGSFQNIVADHDISKPIEISLTVHGRELDWAFRHFRRLRPEYPKLSLMFSVSKKGVVSLDTLELRLEDSARPFLGYKKSSHPVSKDMLGSLRLRSMTDIASLQPYELDSLDKNSTFFVSSYEMFLSRVPEVSIALESRMRSLAKEQPDFTAAEDVEGADELETPPNEIIIRSLEKRLQAYRDYSIERFHDDVVAYNRHRLLLVNQFLPVQVVAKGQTSDPETPFILESRLMPFNSPIWRNAIMAFPDVSSLSVAAGRLVRAELSEATYIGPLRQFPERNYIFSGAPEETVGTRGQNLPNLLFSDNKNIAALNRLARTMDLGYSVTIHKSSDPEIDNVFSVRLHDLTTDARVGLSDVGFGVSQVLPILMECSLGANNTVLIEQPEIHLNPKLQAALGQIIAETIINNPKKQFVIETHSEHLFLRLQKLVRNRVLDPRLLSVLYVSKGSDGSTVLPIELGRSGEMLTPWPDGFFDDEYRELFSS